MVSLVCMVTILHDDMEQICPTTERRTSLASAQFFEHRVSCTTRILIVSFFPTHNIMCDCLITSSQARIGQDMSPHLPLPLPLSSLRLRLLVTVFFVSLVHVPSASSFVLVQRTSTTRTRTIRTCRSTLTFHPTHFTTTLQMSADQKQHAQSSHADEDAAGDIAGSGVGGGRWWHRGLCGRRGGGRASRQSPNCFTT